MGAVGEVSGLLAEVVVCPEGLERSSGSNQSPPAMPLEQLTEDSFADSFIIIENSQLSYPFSQRRHSIETRPLFLVLGEHAIIHRRDFVDDYFGQKLRPRMIDRTHLTILLIVANCLELPEPRDAIGCQILEDNRSRFANVLGLVIQELATEFASSSHASREGLVADFADD